MSERIRHTNRLLKAQSEGAVICDWASVMPVEYAPRNDSDAYPWVSVGIHLPARSCVAVWPNADWTNSSGDAVTRDKPWTPYTVVYNWSSEYLLRTYHPYFPDPKGVAFQVWAPDGDVAGDFAEALSYKRLGGDAVYLEHVVCLHGHAYEVGEDF
ncbi:hypothetical protein [Kitasatospora purpeofusca]|uniref:hypothetical protein n=1 Tax=Kitasatospora purpeofusca TaxID=67352 RepID=UPI00364DE704